MIKTDKFDIILREYEEKRRQAEHDLDARRNLIYSKVPRLHDIDRQISSLAVSTALSRIKGDIRNTDLRADIEKLSAQKEALLRANGFSPSDLEIRYECEKCQDTGFSGGAYCTCLKTKLIDTLYDQLETKELLKTENFGSFSYDYYSNEVPESESESPLTLAKKAVFSAIDFINNFEHSHDNLLITGTTGVGKTFLINCITKELLDRGYFVIYFTSGKLMDMLSESAFNRTDQENSHITRHIDECDLLVIDDLGTEFTNRFVISELFDIINRRLVSGRHTVISSNLALEQMPVRYGDRIFSRFCGSYKILRLSGDDIRIRKGLEK